MVSDFGSTMPSPGPTGASRLGLTCGQYEMNSCVTFAIESVYLLEHIYGRRSISSDNFSINSQHYSPIIDPCRVLDIPIYIQNKALCHHNDACSPSKTLVSGHPDYVSILHLPIAGAS